MTRGAGGTPASDPKTWDDCGGTCSESLSPQAILEHLVALFPGFAGVWDDPANLFREKDGSFTPCGVFAGVAGLSLFGTADLAP
jgi:hypothetical protein